jgi:hypothetical protein
MKTTTTVAAVAVWLLGAAPPATAQLASPSTPALGLGDNYTAAARGYSAVAWNPAGLALTGNPAWSLTLVTPRGIAGIGPVTLADLAEWQDAVVPMDVRQRWLADISAAGGQTGTGGFDATWLGLQIGPFALQGSTSARAVSDIAPGFAQLIMFGNADAQGVPQTIGLAGSSLDMNVYSTMGVSYAMPFAVGAPGSLLSVGVTAKYTAGHFMALGDESAGQATASPLALQLSFPLVHSPVGDGADFGNSGGGFGFDVGVGYELDNMTFGLAVQNLVNTFAWRLDDLTYRPARVSFSQDQEFISDFEEQPVSSAPAALRGMVDDMTFRPSVAAGAMMRYTPELMITADARFGAAGGMATRATTHLGAGAEYRLLPWLPLRAGAAYLQETAGNSGVQFGGGLGISVGGYNVSASFVRRSMDLGTANVVMFSLLSFGR